MRYKKPVYLVIFSVIFAVLPIISIAIAYGIASLNDCRVNEAGANPCMVFGMNVGDALYSMNVLGWFALFTIPIGVVGLIIGVFWTLFVFTRKRLEKT